MINKLAKLALQCNSKHEVWVRDSTDVSDYVNTVPPNKFCSSSTFVEFWRSGVFCKFITLLYTHSLYIMSPENLYKIVLDSASEKDRC